MPNIPDSVDITPSAFYSSSGGGLFGASDYQIGQGLSAAGDLFGGIGDYMAGQSTAAYDKFEQQMVEQSTALQSMMQKRQAYRIQSAARADIGDSGLADSGSAQEILRMNAQNLALDNGIINQQGAVRAGALGMQARAAETAGTMGLISGIMESITKAGMAAAG